MPTKPGRITWLPKWNRNWIVSGCIQLWCQSGGREVLCIKWWKALFRHGRKLMILLSVYLFDYADMRNPGLSRVFISIVFSTLNLHGMASPYQTRPILLSFRNLIFKWIHHVLFPQLLARVTVVISFICQPGLPQFCRNLCPLETSSIHLQISLRWCVHRSS